MSEAKIVVTAQDNASRVLSSVRASMGDLGQSAQFLTGLLGGIGVGSLVGLAALTKGIVNGLDAMNDLKDATGASIENISALEDVAARTGTSFDTVGTSLIKFNQALNSADPDSKAAKALEAIGLSAKELKALDPAEALRRTAVALAGFADDGNKARLTQELFGKSLKDVAPFLKDLAEQGALVAKVTTEQAQAAEDFNKQLFSLKKSASDAARSLVSEFVPALTEVLDVYSKGGLGKAVDEIGNKLFDWEGSQSRKIIGNIKSDLADLQEQSDAITIDLFGQKGRLAKEIEAKTAQLESATKAYIRLLDGSAAKNAPKVAEADLRTSAPDIGGKPPKKGKDEDADYKRYLENLQRQLEKTQDLTVYEQLLVDIKQKRLSVSDGQQKELEALAATIDQKRALSELEKEAAKQAEEERKAHDKYLDGLLKEQLALAESNAKLAEHVEEIGLTTEGLNALRLARIDNTIAIEKQALANAILNAADADEIEILEKKIELLKQQRDLTAKGQVAQAASDTKKEQDQAAKDFAKTLNNDLKGAFSAAFRDSKDPIGAFGNALADVMYSRASTALTEALMEAASSEAFKSFFGSGSSSSSSSDSGGEGGGFADLFSSFASSFDGGGSTGRGPRSGGLDGKGGFMAMLHPQETVLDHTRGQGMGGVSVVVNVDAAGSSANGDGPNAQQLGALIGNSVRAVLLQEKRNGGLLAA